MAKPRPTYLPPDGRLRLSQLVTTHGPGAMIDLVDTAVLVSGLEYWSYQGAQQPFRIDLPRLRDRILKRGIQLQRQEPFRMAPPGDERDPSYQNGVPVFEFPTWFVCSHRGCRTLRRASELDTKKGRRWHRCDDGKLRVALPVRFVMACPAGHLEELPWKIFVHAARSEACDSGAMTLQEGRTGDFSELEVRCSCGARQRMMSIYEMGFSCHGGRPWLGKDAHEPCQEKQRLLIRTASHGYFPQVVSALAIPEQGAELRDRIQTVWDVAHNVKGPEDVPGARKFNDKFRLKTEGCTDAEVWKAIQEVREGKDLDREPLRTAEFKRFLADPVEKTGDLPPPPGQEYFARRVDVAGLPPGVATVVLAHRLRVVSVQVGFTRLEAPAANIEGEYDLEVKSAALTLGARWLPATEARGEGVFIRLDPAALEAWEARQAVAERARCLECGYERWKREKAPEAGEFLGVRYYLLHSLSHLLMSAMALECGYSGSALQERIYCSGPKEAPWMAGILISTGTSGSEGSLGGLVEQGRELGRHLERALRLGRLCSNDPVCASHNPEADLAERYREGAACHGCLFISEPSCERFNQYLDRALVVPAIGHEGVAFFA
jgi:hypothetical protein